MTLKNGDFCILDNGKSGYYDAGEILLNDGTTAPADGVTFCLRYAETTLDLDALTNSAVKLPPAEIGSRGIVVCLIQQALKCHGYPCDVDGVFGMQTYNALREFMIDHYLDGDTIADSRVYSLLFNE